VELFDNPNPNVTFVPPVIQTCPYPLVVVENAADTDPPCFVGCPDLTYPADKWSGIVVAGTAAGIVSFVLMVFMIVSYLLVPAKRVFPARVVIYQFIGVAIFISSFGLYGTDEQNKVWCYDKSHVSTQDNNWKCALQGFTIVYGSLTTGTWWVILSFNLYLSIVKEKVYMGVGCHKVSACTNIRLFKKNLR
jgi:hypothetical protein